MAEPFRIGVVGLASSHLEQMIRALEGTGDVTVVAAAEKDTTLHAAFTRGPVYRSTSDLYDAEHLDAVLVACDNALKGTVVASALARGVAVYQDKPLALDAAAGERLRDANVSDIAHMVAYHTVFDPGLDEFAELIRAGVIGEPVFGRGLAGHAGFSTVGVSPEFEAWLTDPLRGGGGSFIDQAGYPLTLLTTLIGEITEVVGLAGDLPSAVLPVEQNTVCALRFANGALGEVDTRWGQHGAIPLKIAVHGTVGTASWFADRIVVDSPTCPGEDWKQPAPGRWELAIASRTDYTDEAAHFVEVLRGRVAMRPEVAVASSLHVQRVIDAYYRSVATGARVHVAATG